MSDLSHITAPALLNLIGTPACPVLIDVCIDADFAEDPVLIPGARRWQHSDLDGMAQMIAERPCIIVCQKGLKLSQGVAAWLRATGRTAQALRGGMVAWRETDGAPAIPAAALPDRHVGATRWVVRDASDLATAACQWLIRRFIDPDAEILAVTPDAIPGVAQHFGATAVPTEPGNPFAALCRGVSLQTQALGRLASVIHAADTGRWDGSPEAAGLAAIWANTPREGNDRTAVLDALYRWAVGTGNGGPVDNHV